MIKFIVDKEVRQPLNTVIKTSIERRFDALFELKDGSILHIEVQSYNDKKMPERMFEYYALLRSKYKNKNIIQKVLYIGDDKMKMSNELKTPYLHYKYDIIDIRDIPCDKIVDSNNPGDLILSILYKIKDPDNYVKRVIDRILSFPEDQRKRYLDLLLTLADLRPIIKEKMLSLKKEIDMTVIVPKRLIKKNPVYKMGLEEGEKRGILEAKRITIVNLYKEVNLSPEKIAKIVDLPIDKVEDILKEAGLLS